jgi:hypothetical protein
MRTCLHTQYLLVCSAISVPSVAKFRFLVSFCRLYVCTTESQGYIFESGPFDGVQDMLCRLGDESAYFVVEIAAVAFGSFAMTFCTKGDSVLAGRQTCLTLGGLWANNAGV